MDRPFIWKTFTHSELIALKMWICHFDVIKLIVLLVQLRLFESPMTLNYHNRVYGESYVIIFVYTPTNFNCAKLFVRQIRYPDFNSQTT